MKKDYICSECKAELSSEGTDALDHMVKKHGVDPEGPPQEDAPYLVPLESNPVALLEDQ